jgi:large repetitive protein
MPDLAAKEASSMRRRLFNQFYKSGIRIIAAFSVVAVSLLAFVRDVSAQSSVLSVTPLTWNIIGLDSNSPASGPRDFPVGARVCNTGAGALSNVNVTFNWTSVNAFVNLRPGTLSAINIASLAAGTCYDAYFEVEVTTTAAAFDTTRSYVITATSGAETASTPQPRQLYVEHLISQNRNATINVEYGTNLGSLTPVTAGGTMNLLVGETYYIRLFGSTATQGYEQLESFLTLSNTIFQILSVSTTYSADTSPTVPAPNPALYANGCLWENDPNSPNYRACLATGKAGGSVVTTYQVTILSGGGTTQTLNSLLYDFSGSSYHYNSDFSTGVRFAAIINPASATIAKQFSPASTTAGGISTLIITLGNPNGGALSGYNFVDNLPSGLIVASPPQASTNGCGTPTFAPTAGATTLNFSNGTVAANGTCTISVRVTAATAGTYNNVTNNLFINSLNTGNSANASLTVTTAPTPPACVSGVSLATWTFSDAAMAVPASPSPSSSSVTASAATGSPADVAASTDRLGTAGSNSWLLSSVAAISPLNTSSTEYFEFSLNTTGVSSVNVSFYMNRTAQGPTGVALYYGSAGTETQASLSSSTVTTTFLNFTAAISTGINTSGTTRFRIYVFNAGNSTNIHGARLDDVSFTGCVIPTPPSIVKAFSPNPIGAGGTSTLTFTLTNTITIALTGVSFSDTLPAGMTIAAAATTNCGGTLTATIGTGNISLASGGIGASGSCTISVPVTSSTAGPSTNISGFITSTQTGPNNTATGSASATLTVLSAPQISKLFATSPIVTGGISTLTFTITNPNQNNAISSVAFSDTLPTTPGAMVVASPTGVSNSCGGTFTPVAGAGSISLTNGSIVAGGSCTLSVNVSAPTAGTYNNTSSNVSHIVNGTTFNGNTASSTLTVNAPNPAISVLKQVSASSTGPWSNYLSVAVGGNVFYQITIENTGDVPLSPVTVTDPNVSTAGCTWTNPLPVAVAANDNHISTCVIGPVTASGTVNPNTATASGTYLGVPRTDTSTATYATAALTLNKTANPTVFNTLGQVITYTLTVSNSGSATVSGPVVVSDNLATDETCPALTTVGDGDSFFDPGESIACSATYTITAADMSSGLVTNTATASSGGITSLPDSATVNRILADLSLTKTVDNAAPTVGSNITYTITVSNAGPSNATGVTVLDQLPAGLAFVSANPAPGTTYDNTTGVWTIGNIAAAGNTTLQITATVNVAGGITNSAQVNTVNEPDPDSTAGNGTGNGEDDQASASIQQGTADLSLSKTVNNATPNVGSSVIFTITVSNAGPNNATGVQILDQLPAGYTFVSATPSQGSYSSATGAWLVGTVNSGANATLQITATVNITGSYANTAQVSASNQTDPDSTPNNNNAGEDDQATNMPTPVPVADLFLSKTVNNATPNVGSSVIFTITVNNAGSNDATGVEVLDQLPAGYTFSSATASQGTYSNITGVWVIGAVNAGANATLQITATVNATGPYGNTAQVSAADQTDPDSTPNNNNAGEDDQATNTPTPAAVADLSLTKTVSNATPNVGTNVTFTVTLTNNGPSTATNVGVLDQLPAGYTFVSATPSQGAYSNITGMWAVGTVNAGANATLQITATVNATGPYGNTAQVSAADQTDPDSTPNNNNAGEDDQATNTPTPVGFADLSLIKTVSNPSPTIGSNVTFTITISNVGPNDATNVAVLDQLPTGYTFVSAAPSQGTYDNTTGLWTVGTVLAASNPTLQITVTVNPTGSYANTTQVSASDMPDPDSTPGNNTAGEDDQTTNTPVPLGVADLSMTKTVSNPTPNVGTNVTFTVTVTNNGPSTATGAEVLDQLPAGYTFVSATVSQGTYDSLTGVWTVGTVSSGANATLQITATVNATGSYTNTAQVSASNQTDPDSTPGNNNPAEDDQISNTPVPVLVADLSLAKAVDNPNPTVGTNIVYTLTLSNAGPNNATNVTVTDVLPAGVTFVSSTTVSGSYDNITGVWTVGTVNSGANATLQITVTVNAAGAITNSAQVSASDQIDPDSTPNNGTGNGEDDQARVTTPQGVADLALNKTVNNATPNMGSNVVFTLALNNTGPDSATGVTVLDQLPSGYTFVSAAPSQGTYSNITGVWTIGTVNAGANATLQLTATVNAAGIYTNTAQVMTSDQGDPNSTPNNNVPAENDQSSVATAPIPVADLSLAKAVNNPNPSVGSSVIYTVTVSNAGPGDATNVVVTDQLPASVTYLTSTPAQGTYDDTTGLWTVGTINAGSTVTLQITVSIDVTGIITNAAQVTASDQTDPDSTPNNGTGNGEDDQDSVSTPQGVADLSLGKLVSNPTPNVGSSVVFTLTLNNAGPNPATNVAVQDTLPAGYTFVSSTPSQGTYSNITGVWTVGTVNSGASATLQLTATVNAAGSYANTSQVSASDQNDPDSTPNNSAAGEDDQSTATTVPVEVADLALAKSVSNPNPTVGSNFVYTLTLSNVGPSNATNVIVADQLPAGVTFVSAASSQGVFDNTTGVWNVGTVAASASATLQITVTLNAAGAVTNSAQVTASDQLDPDSTVNNGIGNGEDDQVSVTTPQGIADLSVSNAVSTTTPAVGSTITFTVVLTNAGPDDATNVIVQDSLPAGYTFVSATASQGTYNAATGIWAVGTVMSGTTMTLQITATVNAVGPYVNTAQVGSADQFDPDSTPNNNVPGEDDLAAVVVIPVAASSPPTPTTAAAAGASANQPAPIIDIVDPVIMKSVNPPFSQPGETVTWTITVMNPGSIPATRVVVVDNMPPEVEITSVTATQGNIMVNNQTVTFTLAVLGPGQSATITIVTRVRDTVAMPFRIINTASILNAEDPNPRMAAAQLVSVSELPMTGEIPAWRNPVLGLIMVMACCILSLIFGVMWRIRQHRSAAQKVERP